MEQIQKKTSLTAFLKITSLDSELLSVGKVRLHHSFQYGLRYIHLSHQHRQNAICRGWREDKRKLENKKFWRVHLVGSI